MITARILPGNLNAYYQKGGSWDETNPDPNSFTMELATVPHRGSYVMFTGEDGEDRVAMVDDVVFNRSNVYIFVSIR